ncbi:PIN domain-containing protein [Meiothermus ruber]|uniref:PilT domain-containing protein n=1 Tax=Meiothermus ruber (strain ATCC 35948 / DSM 1279 / VKM B-1258 / 21) TaxID=504728 RepID=D3PKF0_MEIRD|nr:PIN domain-containing protein [Meiothermus ruber]GIW29906.1 MAG: twitching motility protein PilT [Meiothermus sp.]ADD26831.1 PilT protein domain protein [Meiothermus ruber DSM 1279]AGK04696.1 PilT domain-containing protein [Meiothermus ruber DSM 1279]MCL6529790.1 PIN domain-containing protein [Meiothermus ruber]GAO73744.1 PilT domain-containing protein [Meiothermus ruber H328]
MKYRYLVDTNLLIYPLDARDPRKQQQAANVLLELVQEGRAALPVQALSEFASVALRRLEPPLSPQQVGLEVERLMQAFPVLPLTAPVVLEALRGVTQHRLSYYDAQVWATARLYQVPLVLSEDFPTGAVLEGVRFLNPLEDALG